MSKKTLAATRAAETAKAVAAAPTALAAYWAGSATASLARDYRAGRVTTVTPAMTPDRVVETAKQFGQKVSKREATVIAALLKGRTK